MASLLIRGALAAGLLYCGHGTSAAKVAVAGGPGDLRLSWSHATAGEVIGTLADLTRRPIRADQRVMEQPIADSAWQGGSAEALLTEILSHADYSAVGPTGVAMVRITRLRDWPGSAVSGEAMGAEGGQSPETESPHAKRARRVSADIADMGEQADKIQQQRAADQAAYFLGFTDQTGQ